MEVAAGLCEVAIAAGGLGPLRDLHSHGLREKGDEVGVVGRYGPAAEPVVVTEEPDARVAVVGALVLLQLVVGVA